MFRLTSTIRPYAWGSTTAIATLLGREPSGDPEAELWLGAHPDSPSVIAPGEPAAGARLDDVIAEEPGATLGTAAAERFDGRLPFLMKVLAAGAPLSLQVHPTIEQAEAGYAAEDEAGVARDASERNYRDRNHKPEMIYALSDFAALSGFRDPAATAGLLREAIAMLTGDAGSGAEGSGAQGAGVRLLAELADLLEAEAPSSGAGASGTDEDPRLRQAFALVFDRREDAALSAEALAGLAPGSMSGVVSPATAISIATAADLQERYPGDPGVIVSLLLNRVSLLPGEALYLPAGNVHAYLSGLGIEVMATSDNVLRGGLTSKHVDVPELLKTVRFAALGVPELPAVETEWGQRVFAPPFDEFALQVLDFRGGTGDGSTSDDVPVLQHGPVLVLVTDGALVLDSPNGSLRVARGDAVFIPAAEAPVMARAAEPGTRAFAATVAREL
ncbi:mannose-6-phosphate isomerase, class I [Tersicoccus sp. Bi-70]|uniref:mannose-6-phosphate isomerase, class I n=1 Tax=Tersicoccus sp. Bi-70 TaxID=1897634 RepID=UPI0009772606|nr:mannose-6-phosphate isomerase, class I [Tersicoccus sp. Bi-70]OMH31408.1 mannose-6-phosphate isomerase, class I [Tersicoccus sp. Bi-70]